MDDLLPEFVAETRDTLQAVAGALVQWEADPADRALLDQIFRFVHTVKGSCGFLDLPRLGRLSHAAEDALAELRAGTRIATPALVSAVLAVIDRIGELVDAIQSGTGVPDHDEAALVAALGVGAVAAEPATPAATPAAASPMRAPPRSVRLPVELLDRMMASVSETVLARNELAHVLGQDKGGSAFERLSGCVHELREAVTRARMSRIEALFAPVPRLVRDLALELGKQVVLDLDGGDVELDREMIEMVRDPLTHIIRNAVDHGVEPPAARAAAGKLPAGRIAVSARQSGNRILITVGDDGNGIDPERVAARAVASGLLDPHEAAAMPTARKLELVFRPGLSTAATVSAISGRGVGMDVVRANVEQLGGSVSIDSVPGRGVTLTMAVPLTLSIIPALTVQGGAHRVAIVRTAIDELVRPGRAVRVERVGGGAVAAVRGSRLPIVDLGLLFGAAPAPDDAVLVILRTTGGGRYALAVGAVCDHEELVIKPAAPAVLASGLFAGTTLPDNSRPMLLLDVNGVAAAAGVVPVADQAEAVAPVEVPTLRTLLVRDLDGVLRAVRLDEVDRIEEARADALVEAGGRRLLLSGGELAPLHLAAPPARDRLPVLRLCRDGARIAYGVAEVVDILPLPRDIVPALAAGPVAGLLLHDNRPVELLDVDWLARAAGAAPAGPYGLASAGTRAA